MHVHIWVQVPRAEATSDVTITATSPVPEVSAQHMGREHVTGPTSFAKERGA